MNNHLISQKKNMVHLYMTIENAIELNTCPYAHGYKGLTCQCRYKFGHAGNCKCFDKTCNLEWDK